MELLNLKAILKQTYGSLSGGQRRRVDIARALINKPNLLFLDEPTTGLDVQTRQVIWDLLRRLQIEEGLTIFLTTHYLEEAEHADMTYIIDQGKVLAKGSAQDLKDQYAQDSLVIKTDRPEAFKGLNYDREGQDTLVFRDLALEEVMAIISQHQDVIEDFDYRKGQITDAFLRITGRENL